MTRSSSRATVIASAFVFAAFVAVALTSVAQIISLRESCEHRGEVQLDSTPAVLCHQESAVLELPISPSVVIVLTAALGAVLSVFVVIRSARQAGAGA